MKRRMKSYRRHSITDQKVLWHQSGINKRNYVVKGSIKKKKANKEWSTVYRKPEEN